MSAARKRVGGGSFNLFQRMWNAHAGPRALAHALARRKRLRRLSRLWAKIVEHANDHVNVYCLKEGDVVVCRVEQDPQDLALIIIISDSPTSDYHSNRSNKIRFIWERWSQWKLCCQILERPIERVYY